MKLSTRGRYGVIAMMDLAMRNSEGCISLKSIAERQCISENYLEQLFASLRKAGLVCSIRGAQGGYTLSAQPEMITLGAVLRALEGSMAPVDCVDEENAEKCDRIGFCVSRLVWKKIRDGINEVVDSMTLADLVSGYLAQKNRQDFMYFI